MITTTGDIIASTLRTAGVTGVGQTPLFEDTNDALDLLIEVIELWKRERFMAWRNVEVVIPSTGAVSYAIPDRPPRLDSAFARQNYTLPPGGATNSGPVDYPLAIIDSQSDYNMISLKEMTSFPAAVWYSPDYPTGSVFFWPVPPEGQFNLHVFYRAGLPTYTTLVDPLNLPSEYVRALRYELAILIQLNYGLGVNKGLVGALVGTKAAIKATNAHVRNLSMPAGLSPQMPGQGGISGSVGPHQSVIVLDSGLPVLG
jgi:hypothetical protein